MADTVRTRHAISGQIDENTPRHVAEHPVLGRHLQVVGPDAKPFLPEMHKPKVDQPDEKVQLPEVTPAVIEKEREASTPNKNGKD